MAKHCEFGAYLDEVLRDRFVHGLNNEGTQKALLTEAELSFAKAVDVTLGREAAAKNAWQLQEASTHTLQEVSKVSAEEGTNCYRCGKARHGPPSDFPRFQPCAIIVAKRSHLGSLLGSAQGPIFTKSQPWKRATAQEVPVGQLGQTTNCDHFGHSVWNSWCTTFVCCLYLHI